VAGGKKYIDDGYEINEITKYLDYINLMTYVLNLYEKKQAFLSKENFF
jgi:GH18 family chitinase